MKCRVVLTVCGIPAGAREIEVDDESVVARLARGETSGAVARMIELQRELSEAARAGENSDQAEKKAP